jgi:hypothetical protein
MAFTSASAAVLSSPGRSKVMTRPTRDVLHAGPAQPVQGVLDGLALNVEDAGLEEDVGRRGFLDRQISSAGRRG